MKAAFKRTRLTFKDLLVQATMFPGRTIRVDYKVNGFWGSNTLYIAFYVEATHTPYGVRLDAIEPRISWASGGRESDVSDIDAATYFSQALRHAIKFSTEMVEQFNSFKERGRTGGLTPDEVQATRGAV